MAAAASGGGGSGSDAAALAAKRSAAAAAAGRPKVLILTGPTAVGKTKASLALAEALGGEIISADSVQVYRGLDIGSDKVRGKGCNGSKPHALQTRSQLTPYFARQLFALAMAWSSRIWL
jgi:tRNA dimethylallyltransferase